MAVFSSRRFVSFVALLFVLCSTTVFSVPTPAPAGGSTTTDKFRCRGQIYQRREWRDMNLLDRFSFLLSLNILMILPARTPRAVASGAKNRYDDLVVTHMQQTFDVHYVGHFLPFHRYLTWTLEKMLREEAGYMGPFPYWDWHRDFPKNAASDPNYSKFYNSPIWDPVLGFGGNGALLPVPDAQAPMAVPGRTGGDCVLTGAFSKMSVNLGPGDDLVGVPRCLKRDMSPYFAGRYLRQNQTKVTLQAPDYYAFQRSVEGGPSFEASGIHGGGHYGIGGTLGTMGDLHVSPGDPAFWLHHANLDRVYWSWQKLNWPARKTEFGGPSCLMDYYTPDKPQNCPNATLDQPLNLGYADVVQRNVGITVREIMDISALCYSYDELLNPATL